MQTFEHYRQIAVHTLVSQTRRLAADRLRLLTAAGAAFGVIVCGSLIQATHGSDAYAQAAEPYSMDSLSNYAIQETGTSSGRSSTGSKSAHSGNPAGSTSAAPGSTSAMTGTITPNGSISVGAATASKSPASTTTSPAPVPAPTSSASFKYPLHTGIKTTWFYAGEPASADNNFIQNISSAWQENWEGYYGGSDNPDSRCGYNPCGFTPRENPFYFALPFSDYTNTGQVHDLSMVYWYTGPFADGQSILKNRWIQITALGKTVYAQWEDVGPFNEHDGAYVFGSSAPASTRAGLDISPATRDYLGMGGSTTSSWRFVDYSEVPAGPWKNTITTSAPDWN